MGTEDATPVLGRKVVFFGGKGGVGKTTVASAFALLSARAGLRTLLVSTDPAHSTSDILEVVLGNDPTRVSGNFYAMEIDPEEETDSYIHDVKNRMEDSIAPRLMPEIERQIDVARVSPGAQESALFDRFTRIIRTEEDKYDRLIFDTAPTGHTLRLLALPEEMSVWISALISQRSKMNALNRMWRNVAGTARSRSQPETDPVLESLRARQRRFDYARDVITDQAKTSFVFVLTPERLPILETEKAIAALEKYRIPVAGVIINRVIPPDVAPHAFLERRRRREAEYLMRIREKLGERTLFTLPLFDDDVVGVVGLERVLSAIPGAERDLGGLAAGASAPFGTRT